MNYHKCVCILPTYNEAKNIRLLIKSIQNECPGMHVLVVDDNSPDGTSRVVSEMAKEHEDIHLVTRMGERGRGLAGIKGFRDALEMGFDVVIEMDADFTHDPKWIPLLVGKLDVVDVALGSRYHPDGYTDTRPILRQCVSRLAHGFIRIVLGIKVVKDCTSGFRAFKSHVLKALPLKGMISKNPSIVEEILLLVQKHDFKITEIPISFSERAHGTSKLNFSMLIKVLLDIIVLRWHYRDYKPPLVEAPSSQLQTPNST